MCMGSEPGLRYEKSLGCRCMAATWAASADGDRDMVRPLGEGEEFPDPVSEYVPPSERGRWPRPDGLDARAAAVAAAASSTVPVWWFWWRVNVVRRVKVF